MSDAPVLHLENITRDFGTGHTALHVLRGAELKIRRGEIIALVGPSGAGKSTLLHIAGLLEKPDGGEIHICGEACSKLGDDRRTEIRRKHLGFVYQYHHLLPEFSAQENIFIPQIIAGLDKKTANQRSAQLLDMLGLAARADHRPAQLSGGEQQRVAIGRALANAPDLLLADEPTGNLDPATAEAVFNMLLSLTRQTGLTALIATHNPELAGRMDRIVRIADGHLV
ncbi:MAG: ABC transporter ATP-binding protein [Alphaproteobacteria bacterium]|nr:ABC transporter ATP-binding protein [Alphaproteobacteria bacterium]MBF0249488.1 ABC transporter ATP-binding protein [Alphaproteobacteria bacterium]